ncbi:MAG: hypothetical protein V1645_00105 [archaeon]
MSMVGFNFDKILIERLNPVGGQVKVKPDISIVGLKKQELSLSSKKKEELLKFDFKFSVRYDPDIGNILIEGHMLLLEDPSDMKKILDSWKKNKEIPQQFMVYVLNNALLRCNIKALGLVQDVGLPPYLRLPTISPKSKASDYIG